MLETHANHLAEQPATWRNRDEERRREPWLAVTRAALTGVAAALSRRVSGPLAARRASVQSPPSNEASATTGKAPGGKLSVPRSVNFWTGRQGATGTKNLLIRNLSRTDSLRVILSDPAAPFAIGGPGRSFLIGPNGRQNVPLTFQPPARGRRMATLSVTSSDPQKPTASVSLIGSGR